MVVVYNILIDFLQKKYFHVEFKKFGGGFEESNLSESKLYYGV